MVAATKSRERPRAMPERRSARRFLPCSVARSSTRRAARGTRATASAMRLRQDGFARATANESAPARRRSRADSFAVARRSEEHTSELQSLAYLVCRLLLEKKKRAECTA